MKRSDVTEMKNFSLKTLAGFFVCTALCTASVFAANTITIDSVSISAYEVDGVEDTDYAQATVNYTVTEGDTPLERITFALSATTPEDTLAGNESKVVYLDEITAPTATDGKAEYSFLIEKARVQSALEKETVADIEGASLLFKMGGVDVDEAATTEVVFGSPKDTMYGDLDMDETITYKDALKALRGSSGNITLTTEEIAVGDVDGDGSITYRDALAILRCSSGNITYDQMIAGRNSN